MMKILWDNILKDKRKKFQIKRNELYMPHQMTSA